MKTDPSDLITIDEVLDLFGASPATRDLLRRFGLDRPPDRPELFYRRGMVDDVKAAMAVGRAGTLIALTGERAGTDSSL